MLPRSPLSIAGSRILVIAIVALVGAAVAYWLLRKPGSGAGARPTSAEVAAAKETPATPEASKPDADPQASNPAALPPAGTVAASEPAGPAKRRERLENFSRQQARPWQADPAQRTALAALAGRLPRADVQFDALTGAPMLIAATDQFLTDAAAPADDAYAPVRRFVDENAALFGHDATALKDSRVTREDVTAHNGMRTVVWQQQVDGIPLYNTVFKANLTKDGALITLGSHFMRDAATATRMDAAQRAALAAQPPVTVSAAISLAAANLGHAVAAENTAATTAAEGAERKQRFRAPGLSDVTGQLAYFY